MSLAGFVFEDDRWARYQDEINGVTVRICREHADREEARIFGALLFIALGCNVPLWKVVLLAATHGRT